MRRRRNRERAGFVLPLALFMLAVVALLASMLLEAAVEELRVSRGDVAAARAQAAAGSALADLLATAPDSAALAYPRGVTASTTMVADAETTRVALQPLGGGLMRVTAGARAWAEGVRADAVSVAFVRIVPDSAGVPGSLRYQRLPGWWWVPIP